MKLPKTFIPDKDLSDKIEVLEKELGESLKMVMKIADKKYDNWEQMHEDVDAAIRSIYKKISGDSLSLEQKKGVKALYWMGFTYAMKMFLFMQKQDYTREEELNKYLEMSIYSLKTINELIEDDKKDETS